jgi:hypothetical protein
MRQLLHSLIFVAVTSVVVCPQTSQEPLSLEEITKAGNAAIATGDWGRAGSHFRNAVKLAPKQGLWRIELVLVLGQQKKWKAAFEEMEPLAKYGATDWIVTTNRNLPDGKVAFIDSDRFRNERNGIPRYVAALRKASDAKAVAQDIGVKLDAFADQHKIALVYDISKFKALPFEKGRTLDATSEFIAYYNSSEYTQKYYGTVYLYRGVDTVNYGTQIIVLNPEAVVFLDGKEFLRMPEKTFIGFRVPVGSYVLQMPWNGGRARNVLTVEPNGTYYLRVEQHAYPNPFQTISYYDEKTALDLIRTCYALSAKKLKLQVFEVIKQNPNDDKK